MEKKEKRLAPKAIDDKEEKDIAGGYYYRGGIAKGRPHEVLDDATAEVLGRYSCRDTALLMAKEKGQCTEEINWDTVDELRKLKTR